MSSTSSERPWAAPLLLARLLKKWSQHRLAKEMGASPSHLQEMEAGKTTPKLETLIRWADALDHDVVISVEPRIKSNQSSNSPVEDVTSEYN